MSRMRYYLNQARFLTTQRLVGFSVPDEPCFDQDSTALFMSLIKECRLYMEYGSGGSTVTAARLGKSFISVETDRYFSKSVGKKIGALAPDQRLIHADIGLTGIWGKPLRIKKLTSRRLKKWGNYAETPWQLLQNGQVPDLILVDGRFRVNTALTCLDKLSTCSPATILVDDYAGRSYYHVIERYANLTKMVGRMALFKPYNQNNDELGEAIKHFATDWR